jgi:ferric-chelate reductase [NAD(P)H]
MTDKIDPQALNHIQYGVFIITSFLGERINGQIATVVFQVTSNPTQIVTCLNKDNLTHEFVMASKAFGVSILSQDADLKFIGRFGFRCGRDFDKCQGIKYKKSITGSPLIIEHTSSILDLRVKQTVDVGTHTLFVGELLAAEKLNDNTPLTYDYYHNVIKGKTQKNAPTFQTKPIS